MIGLTVKQAWIFDTIRVFRAKHGYMPTRRDLMYATGLKSADIAEHLRVLVKKGRIECDFGKARAIRIRDGASPVADPEPAPPTEPRVDIVSEKSW